MKEELIPLSEARARIHELVRTLGDRTAVIVRHSRPVGALLTYENYRGLLQRIDDLENRLRELEADT